MKNATGTINDQFKMFADMQAKSMEQMMPFATMAADATNKLIKKNYEVMGDWVNYTVEATQLPLSGDAPSEIAAAQMAATKKLSETMSERAAEYVEMAKSWGEQMQDSTEKAKKSKAA